MPHEIAKHADIAAHADIATHHRTHHRTSRRFSGPYIYHTFEFECSYIRTIHTCVRVRAQEREGVRVRVLVYSHTPPLISPLLRRVPTI